MVPSVNTVLVYDIKTSYSKYLNIKKRSELQQNRRNPRSQQWTLLSDDPWAVLGGYLQNSTHPCNNNTRASSYLPSLRSDRHQPRSADKRVLLYHIGTFDRGFSNISYSLKDNGISPLQKIDDIKALEIHLSGSEAQTDTKLEYWIVITSSDLYSSHTTQQIHRQASQ